MGIYDRDYYRQNSGGFWGAIGDRGQVIKVLLLANIAVFVFQLVFLHIGQERDGPYQYGLVSGLLSLDVERVMHGEVWRLLTYAFVHDPGSIWHILFNMLFLWWFGRDVEDLYGPREFLAFYLVSAFLGGVIFTLCNLGFGLAPAHGTVAEEVLGKPYCMGASGAVMAVLVLCACHYPYRNILLFFIIPVPIWLCVLFWVAQDALVFFAGWETTTAVSVHLAGAAFAFLYYKFQWRLLNLWSALWSWRQSRPRLRVVRDEDTNTPVPVGPKPSADVDEHLEAQVDAVLEKVSRYGQDSLTDSEREILFKASEVYRKRRPTP